MLNIFKQTTLYKLYNFIKTGIQYQKVNKVVGKTFYSNEFKLLIANYLKTHLKEDWIGRLYGVINPTIDINGNLDISTMVIELDGNNTNNADWVKNWLYKQLQLIAQLFKIEKLYDYINLDIKHVGPIEMDNYLIVFDLVARKSFTNAAKSLGKNIIFWIIVCFILFGLNSWLHFF